MSKTPNFDKKIQGILAATKPGERVCALTGEKWQVTDEEIGWYKKFNVPPSDLAPFVRWKFRAASYTGYQFWYNKDCESGETLITHVHPATPWKVMKDKSWFQKDFSSENLPFDSKTPFFDLIEQLIERVPINAFREFEEPKNSIGCLISLGDIDGYFNVATKSRGCFYCADDIDIEDCQEVILGRSIQRSFDVLRAHNIADSKMVRESRDCLNCYFIFDCRNCEKCFFSWNQRNKKYLWKNEQLTPEEWERRFAELELHTYSVYSTLRQSFQKAIGEQAVWPENFNVHGTGSNGEYLSNCVRCTDSYYTEDSTNCSWSCYGKNSDQLYHTDAPWSQNSYFCSVMGNSSGCKMSWVLVRCQDCEYCINCYDCEDCFGCVGLHRKQFHIFNKPYSEEEYWKKLDEVKCAMLDRGEYGKPFPVRFSQGWPPHCGMGWLFGMTTEEIAVFHPREFDVADHGAFGPLAAMRHKARSSADVPDTFDAFTEAWIGVPIFDEKAGRVFTFQKHEVAFGKKFGIPPSPTHFISRFYGLAGEINRPIWIQAACQSCSKSISVAKNFTYTSRKVYCTKCYLGYLEKNG